MFANETDGQSNQRDLNSNNHSPPAHSKSKPRAGEGERGERERRERAPDLVESSRQKWGAAPDLIY